MSADPELGSDPATVAVLAILNGTPTAVVVSDDAGRITFVNDRARHMFGYPGEVLLGQPLSLLMPDRPEDESTPVTVVRRDGSNFPAEVVLARIPEGLFGREMASIRDVSARMEREARANSLSRAYLTLAQANEALVRARDEDALFELTCRLAVAHGGYLAAWVGQATSDSPNVAPVTHAGPIEDLMKQVTISTDADDPSGRGLTGAALRDGAPYFSDDLVDDPGMLVYGELALMHGIRSYAILPLICHGDPVAVLTLYSGEPHYFHGEMRSLAERLADNVSFALDSLAETRRLQQVALERSELMGRLVTAAEDERARIAAEVHDDSIQVLGAVEVRLGLLHSRVQTLAPQLEAEVIDLQDTVALATDTLRRLLFDLEPLDEGASCATALEEAATHIFAQQEIVFTVSCSEPVSLADVAHTQALRIAKEAMINVRKHAQATHVSITVTQVGEGVSISVADNGIGISSDLDVAAATSKRGGLSTMRERAELVGGWVRIEPGNGGGTTLKCWIPSRPAGDPIGR